MAALIQTYKKFFQHRQEVHGSLYSLGEEAEEEHDDWGKSTAYWESVYDVKVLPSCSRHRFILVDVNIY